MKLTVQRVFDVTPLVTAIINEKRSMPQIGKFRLARLHAKLKPEYDTAAAQYDALVVKHGDAVIGDAGPTGAFRVTDEHMPEFTAEWRPIGDTEVEVDVEPLRIHELDSVEAHEIVTLGDLVTE